MRGFFWLVLAVLLFMTWVVSYFMYNVPGVRIHLLLILALVSVMIHVFTGKRSV